MTRAEVAKALWEMRPQYKRELLLQRLAKLAGRTDPVGAEFIAAFRAARARVKLYPRHQ